MVFYAYALEKRTLSFNSRQRRTQAVLVTGRFRYKQVISVAYIMNLLENNALFCSETMSWMILLHSTCKTVFRVFSGLSKG
jgi:hypothetical protein